MDIMTSLFDQDYITELYGIDKEREGIKKGVKKGIKEGAKNIAKSLKESGMDVELIVKHTGLSEDEIKEL